MKRISIVISSMAALTIAGCGDVSAPPANVSDRTAVAVTMKQSSDQIRADASTRVVSGYRDNYTIVNSNGILTITNKLTGEVETLPSVALIKFADRFVSFDVDGTSGKVYRLYQAAFNRKPDLGGLGYWIARSEQGATMEMLSQAFMGSQEYAELYGSAPSASNMVDKWYNNVLHRAPEPAGFTYWVDALNRGLLPQQALVSFSEGEENRKNVLADLNAGFEYIPIRTEGSPIVPYPTSYENMKKGTYQGEDLDRAWQGDATAFGDFFQDGTISIVTHTLVYDPTDIQTSNKLGTIHFFRKMNGQWVDNTSKLLSNPVGCLHPRKAVVADFNGDAKADVFFACHGFDAPPFSGEKQVFLMSQPDGSYKNSKTEFDCFCHGASAAVLKNKGYADLLIADQTVEKRPYFLINKGDGTFSKDFSRLPDMNYKQIWTAELIDVNHDGKVDAFLAGADPIGDGYQIPPTIFINDGNNSFNGAKIDIPLAPIRFDNAATLDIVFESNSVYLLRTNYAAVAVQKTDLSARTSKTIYEHAGPYATAKWSQSWFPWLTIHGDTLVPYNIKGVTIPKD